MEYDPGKLLKSLSGAPPVKGDAIISAFQAAPNPETTPVPTPVTAPLPPGSPAVRDTAPPVEKPAAQESTNLEARLAGIERKLEEAAQQRPPQDRELLDYMKQKINELEKKLIESQEKGLAFAYEVKGREEARKESRHEMEAFLTEVKRQKAESETERSRGLELEKARGRIEALELKILEFSAPRPEPPAPLKPENLAEEIGKLKNRLDAESSARGKDNNGLRLLAGNIAGKVSSMESDFSKRLAELRAGLDAESSAREKENDGLRLLAGDFSERLAELKAGLDTESSARGKDASDLQMLASAIADKVSYMEIAFLKRFAELEAPIGAEFGKMALAMEEFRAGLSAIASGLEISRTGASWIVEDLKQTLRTAGADTTIARRFAAGYNLGFMIACFSNLEKAFCAGAETLGRAGSAARQAAGAPGTEAALIARRQADILDSAARDFSSALEIFRGVRQEALKPIKKILGE